LLSLGLGLEFYDYIRGFIVDFIVKD
jgi:hypothetical protein